MREIRVYAPAKLNLYLNVLNKRPDGFHDIETIFEKISLRDEIIIREKGKGLKVSADMPDCGQGNKNIVYKAARALFKEIGIGLNLDIKIRKNIPVSAGLGGGSSDAASALKAINEIFNLNLPRERLFSIACGIGKDVPFFMLDTPFAAAKGAGEVIKAISLDKSFFHILVKPMIPLSTKLMYQRIDRLGPFNKSHSFKDALNALKSGAKELEKKYYNIFENALGEEGIYIDEIKTLLAESGAKKSLLSGSGPTVFCVFENEADAVAVFQKIPQNKRLSVFLAETYK